MTGRVTPVVAQMLRAAGHDVRVVTPDEGTGTFMGTVWAVGHQVTVWSGEGWKADLFLEFHGQALGSPAVRGQFVIYPDALQPPDVDVTVRDVFGPRFTKALATETDVPVYGDGTLSERKTQVGIDGFRLGIFSATSTLSPHTKRCIAEIMTYTNAQDTAIMLRSDYPEKVGRALVNTLAMPL